MELALDAGAAVVATGRSDYPNQSINVLCFPGIFRGALEARATELICAMKIAAAHASAGLSPEPTAECSIPSPIVSRVVLAVAHAVADAARKTGAGREV